MRLLTAFAVFAIPLALSAQVTLTAQDMFNEVGQFYESYGNNGDISVAGLIGTANGPQLWNFSTGPTDLQYRYDIVAPDDQGHDADFPTAEFTERKTRLDTGDLSWLYLSQVPGLGRENFGFYDEGFNAGMPSNPFNPSIVDFPDPLNFQDTWSVSTSWETTILGLNTIINYQATSTVDGWGTLNLPSIGFGNCLRVNELASFNTLVDFFGDGNYQDFGTEYIRSYYFMMEDRGIAAAIVSGQQSSPVPDQFTTAAQYTRMFNTNHGTGPVGPQPVEDLEITFSSGAVLLSWSSAPGATSYRVESSINPFNDSWTELVSTTGTFYIDFNPGTRGNYRVIAMD